MARKKDLAKKVSKYKYPVSAYGTKIVRPGMAVKVRARSLHMTILA